MRRGLAVSSMLALALFVPACGDDDEAQGPAKPAPVAFELSGSGKQKKLTGPRSITGGLVRIEFTNSTDEGAGVQFVRGTAGHSGAEALKAAATWGEKGKPLPDWVKIEGGTATAARGKTSTAVQDLPAGDYMAVDIDSNAATPLKVTGGEAGELPSADARIEATEYKFTATGLKAGANTVEFENVGKQPHFFAAAQYKPGATLEEVRRFIRTEKGKPPFVEDEDAEAASALLDGGGKQVIELALRKGKYALLCFVPDRTGGPPHVVKGMISEAIVN